ncbi:MAG: PIN domain-containing protein [Chloroflexi bacterium]|nr:PIN domain-containing protein [Chloroflexota bacterium]
MSVFVDTSALLAVLDADDDFHPQARRIWGDLLQRDEDLFCTSYVLVECFALVQNRLGIAAVRALVEDVLPVIRVQWMAPEEHRAGVSALLTTGRRDLSLVDCVSFDSMRRSGVPDAFAFDQDFAEQGFRLLE